MAWTPSKELREAIAFQDLTREERRLMRNRDADDGTVTNEGHVNLPEGESGPMGAMWNPVKALEDKVARMEAEWKAAQKVIRIGRLVLDAIAKDDETHQ